MCCGECCGTVTSSFRSENDVTGNYKYTVKGVDLGRDWCSLGLGGEWTRNNLSVFGGYDFMIRGTQNLHTGNVGVSSKF